jgi:hypothetical protein
MVVWCGVCVWYVCVCGVCGLCVWCVWCVWCVCVWCFFILWSISVFNPTAIFFRLRAVAHVAGLRAVLCRFRASADHA